jgi:hypothetical protein
VAAKTWFLLIYIQVDLLSGYLPSAAQSCRALQSHQPCAIEAKEQEQQQQQCTSGTSGQSTGYRCEAYITLALNLSHSPPVGKLLVHVTVYLMLPAGILLPLFQVLLAANHFWSIITMGFYLRAKYYIYCGLIEMYVLCT